MTTADTIPHTLAEMYRHGSDISSVYVDVSIDTGDPPEIDLERRISVQDRLRRLGAPQADIDAVVDVMATQGRSVTRSCLFTLVSEGRILLAEVLPGLPVAPEAVSFGRLPDVSPLLIHRPDLRYVVVETARDGGEIRLHRIGAPEPEQERELQGRTDTLHKPQAGGWRHDRYQNHVEEIWRRTQAELATEIDRIVREHRPRLVVVAGDIRARQLLETELGTESRALLAVEPTDTRAAGSDDQALEDRVTAELERLMAAEKAEVMDRIGTHEGRGDNTVETSLGGIVHALASAQVDTLVLNPGRLAEHELLALDAEPWVASAPEEALGAAVLDRVPAVTALTRAALLTDARVLFTDSRSVPDGSDAIGLAGDAPAAALLRWRTGPPVPGA